MPFLGVEPVQEFASVAKQTITGTGATAYSLDNSVASANDLAVFVNNVRQEPTSAYTASGGTITFTSALASTDSCYVMYIARTFSSASAEANSVGITELNVSDGTNGQALTTNGSGTLSFSTISSSTPTLNAVTGAGATTTNAITVGNLTATGIYIGGTGSANYLNDYEEGTWTPKFWYANSASDQRHFTGGDSEVDVWGTTSRYTKIGDMVTCWFDVTNFSLTSAAWTALNSAGSFNLSTDGLPFTVSDRDKLAGTFTTGASIGQYNGTNLTGTLQGLYHFRAIVAFVVSRMDSTSSVMNRASVGHFVDLSGTSGQFRGVFSYYTTA